MGRLKAESKKTRVWKRTCSPAHLAHWPVTGIPENLESGISSLIAAANWMHGQKINYEVISSIVSRFERLRDSLPQAETYNLSSGGALSLPQEETVDEMPDPEPRDRTAEPPAPLLSSLSQNPKHQPNILHPVQSGSRTPTKSRAHGDGT